MLPHHQQYNWTIETKEGERWPAQRQQDKFGKWCQTPEYASANWMKTIKWYLLPNARTPSTLSKGGEPTLEGCEVQIKCVFILCHWFIWHNQISNYFELRTVGEVKIKLCARMDYLKLNKYNKKNMRAQFLFSYVVRYDVQHTHIYVRFSYFVVAGSDGISGIRWANMHSDEIFTQIDCELIQWTCTRAQANLWMFDWTINHGGSCSIRHSHEIRWSWFRWPAVEVRKFSLLTQSKHK